MLLYFQWSEARGKHIPSHHTANPAKASHESVGRLADDGIKSGVPPLNRR